MKNPNCDKDKCTAEDSEVRILPTGSMSNAIVCEPCFNHEIVWRREQNKKVPGKFKTPTWNELQVYQN